MKNSTQSSNEIFRISGSALLFSILCFPQALYAFPFDPYAIKDRTEKPFPNKTDSIPEVNKENITVLNPDVPHLLQPDWQYGKEYFLYDYFPEAFHLVGDFNGDGIDDLILPAHDGFSKNNLIQLYFGSETGLPSTPNSLLFLDATTEFWGQNFKFYAIGDINGDGFDDACSNETLSKANFYLGSPSGLPDRPNFSVDIPTGSPFIPHPAGDINGDGYEDLILSFHDSATGVVIYGGPDESLNMDSWHFPISHEEVEDPYQNILFNDLNNDGYSDIIYHINSTNYLTVYYGSPDGLNQETPLILSMDNILGSIRFVITGDFDGDGYGDIIYTTEELIFDLGYRYKLIELRGTSSGIEQDNAIVYYDYIENDSWYGRFLSFLGDINNDGLDDFLYYNNVYLGSVYMPYLDKEYRYYNFTINHLFIEGAGDFNGDGSTDLTFKYSPGEYFYSKSYEPFNLSCVSQVEICYKGQDEYYVIPTANFSQSHFREWGSYTQEVDPISKPVYHNSNNNASGIFNKNSIIVWFAEGYNKKQISCTTEVKFKYVPVTNVTIKDAYAVDPGGAPNTIYVGHGPDGFRLAALPSGGGAPYTYLWSNGSTEKNPRITERVPGEYPYWVQLTNAHGCTDSDTVVVKVENALCSSPLVDAVMQSYPMILNNTILNNLIKSNSKVAVCKDGETLCLARSVVDIRLARPGYSLGPCTPGVIPATAFMTEEIEEILAGKLKVLVAPNPSNNRFQLNIASINQEAVTIRITDISGRLVEVINRAATNSTIHIGEKLKAGIYFAEIQAGNEREIIKLIKTN
jgi:hypothetical protein